MANIVQINGKNVKDATAARMASIAPVEASTTASAKHDKGEYFWLNGTLYVATANIASGGTITVGTNCVAAVIGNDFSEIKTAMDNLDDMLDDVISPGSTVMVVAQKKANTTSLPTGFSTTQGYLRNSSLSNPGNITGTSSTTNNTFWMQAETDMDVYVDIVGSGGSKQIGIFSNEPYGNANLYSSVFASNADVYPMPTAANPLHVPAGKYITFSRYNGTVLSALEWTLYNVTTGDASLKSTVPLTSTMESQVDAKIDHVTNDVLMTGYMQIPADEWALHAWDDGYSDTDSRAYRVHCTRDIVFSTPVTLLADYGFYITGYKSDGTSIGGPHSTYVLPANTHVHLNIRRVDEDSSETANVATFAAALKIQTKLSDISLYQPTFTDVSMFERVGVCGDSYASGGGIISGVTALTWGKNLERQAGVTVDIYAKSGQNVVQWVSDSTHGLPALLAGTECGLYWMQHGINGTSTPEALGTAADMTASPHPATFYGQYVEAIEQIKTAFPDARIVLANIIGSSYGLYETNYTTVNAAIAAIAEYCEVPMIDVAADDFYRSKWYSEQIRSNHPTAMQCPGIAMANRRLIAKCIMDNPSYFLNYGNDGTPVE